MPDIQLRRTTDLTDEQIRAFCSLFKEIYHFEKSYDEFKHEYLNTPLGYSYHAYIMKENGWILTHSYIPYNYLVKGERYVFSLGVDTMVKPNEKIGPFFIADAADMLVEMMTKEDISCMFGFPNDDYYAYNKKVLDCNDIGILDFYVLPVNIGQIKKTLSPLNFFIRLFAGLFCRIAILVSSKKAFHFSIEKVDDKLFRKQRYSSRHHWVTLKDGSEVVYTLYDEGKFGKVAYIVDMTKPSPKNFYRAFLEVLKRTGKECSVIAYPSGRLPFHTPLLVPRHFLPRKLHMIGNPTENSSLDDDLFYDIKNWNVNLSNFDTR